MRRIALLLAALVIYGLVPVIAQGPVTPAAPVTSVVFNGSTPLLPKRIIVDTATNGDTEVIAGVSSRRIRVLALFLTMTGTAVTIRFEDTRAGTALTGQMTPSQGQTIVLPFNPVGWFQTTAGNSLNLELGGGQSVDGAITYVEVP